MKTFLFIILTILVHHTIQYDNAEKIQLLRPENSPEEQEKDSPNLKGDIKDLRNIEDYDTGGLQSYFENYQNHYRGLKGKEIVRPLRELRSASEIKNWVKDMIAMRGKGKRLHRPHQPNKRPTPPKITNTPKPPKTTRTPKPIKTTTKPNDSNKRYDLSGSWEIPIEDEESSKEKILLEYTPKHKRVDVPMIIFVPLKE